MEARLTEWAVLLLPRAKMESERNRIAKLVISSEKISVGPPFYHKLIIPFLIPFLIAMAIGPHLKWIKSNLESKKILIFLLFISILISYLVVKNLDKNLLVNTI